MILQALCHCSLKLSLLYPFCSYSPTKSIRFLSSLCGGIMLWHWYFICGYAWIQKRVIQNNCSLSTQRELHILLKGVIIFHGSQRVMFYCDVMVNTCRPTTDLFLRREVREKWSVPHRCHVGEMVTMNGEPSDIWRWCCIGKTSRVSKSATSSYCFHTQWITVQIVYAFMSSIMWSVCLPVCAPVGSRMYEDVKRQLIGCQSRVFHLSWGCCWWQSEGWLWPSAMTREQCRTIRLHFSTSPTLCLSPTFSLPHID